MLAAAIAAIALGLLGVSGIAKLVDPVPTSGALDAARLPGSPILVRLLGGLELASAVAGLALGGSMVAPAVLLYAAFSVFTALAVRGQIPLQACGCFGRDDTPPTVAHVVFNLISTTGLGLVAATGRAPVPWHSAPGDLAVYAVFVGAGVYGSYLVLTALPQTLAAAGES